MQKVRLSKISGGNALRTEFIVGIALLKPAAGRSYVVLSESLVAGRDVREFVTSTVQDVEVIEKGYILKTLNSIYKVEILQENIQEDSLEDLPKEG